MQHYGFSLAPRVLLIYIARTLLVMLGRVKMNDVFMLNTTGLWQGLWASVVITFLVSAYPAFSLNGSLLLANVLIQIVAITTMVLIFIGFLQRKGFGDRTFAYLVPFIWIENVQLLFSGLIQNLIVVSRDTGLMILVAPLVFWSVYWLWRVGYDQLDKRGWLAAGLLLMSFFINAGLSMFLQNRVDIPLG